MNVFVIEGSAFLRERLLNLLTDLRGVNVVGHATVQAEVLEAIRLARPDVVVADLHWLQAGGAATLTEARRACPALRVMVLANESRPSAGQEVLAQAADWVFDKATDFTRVLEILKGTSPRPEAIPEPNGTAITAGSRKGEPYER